MAGDFSGSIRIYFRIFKTLNPVKKPFSIKSIAITAILLAMTYVHAVSQQVPKVSVHGRGYLEYLPPGYATSAPKLYPVIIFLHGSGERGNGTTEINKVSVWGTP